MDQGARVACAGGFLGNVSRYMRRFTRELLAFSYHRYPTNHCAGGRVSPAELLADHASAGMAEWLAPLASTAAAAGVEFVVGEVRPEQMRCEVVGPEQMRAERPPRGHRPLRGHCC